MSKIDVDDNDIQAITGISISEVSGDFSPEWLSCQFMDSVINGINNLISGWEQAKSKVASYVSVNDEISNQNEPDLSEADIPNIEWINASNRDTNNPNNNQNESDIPNIEWINASNRNATTGNN